MKTLMDEVCFEKGGAVVHMRKKSNAGSAAKVMPNDANVLPPGLSYGMVGQDLSVIEPSLLRECRCFFIE